MGTPNSKVEHIVLHDKAANRGNSPSLDMP
jgi:hypothetical protein